jgi:hypothetical protein
VGWKVFAALAAAAVAGHYLVPDTDVRGAVYVGLAVSAVVSCVVGVRVNRPEYPTGWYVFTAGLLVFFLGDGVYYYDTFIRDVERPFPSVADGLFLSSYPLLSAGLLLMIRRRDPGGDRSSLVDACIVATGCGLLAEVYLIAPAVQSGMPFIERAITTAYPVGDVLLLAVAARLAMTTGARRPAYWLLGLAVTSLLTSDLVYAVSQLSGTFEPGTAQDIGWMGFYAFSAIAALHPSMATLSSPGLAHESGSGRVRIFVFGTVVLVAPAVLAVQTVRGDLDELEFVAGASIVLSLLVLARVGDPGGVARRHRRPRAHPGERGGRLRGVGGPGGHLRRRPRRGEGAGRPGARGPPRHVVERGRGGEPGAGAPPRRSHLR